MFGKYRYVNDKSRSYFNSVTKPLRSAIRKAYNALSSARRSGASPSELENLQSKCDEAYDIYYDALHKAKIKSHNCIVQEMSDSPHATFNRLYSSSKRSIPTLTNAARPEDSSVASNIEKARVLNETFAGYCSLPTDFPVDTDFVNRTLTKANSVQSAVKFTSEGSSFNINYGTLTCPIPEYPIFNMKHYLDQTRNSFCYDTDFDLFNANFTIYDIKHVRLNLKTGKSTLG